MTKKTKKVTTETTTIMNIEVTMIDKGDVVDLKDPGNKAALEEYIKTQLDADDVHIKDAKQFEMTK